MLSDDLKNFKSNVRAQNIDRVEGTDLKNVGKLILGGDSCEILFPILAYWQRRGIKSTDSINLNFEHRWLNLACFGQICTAVDSKCTF